MEDVSQRVRRVYKSLILAKTLQMRSSMRCLGGFMMFVLVIILVIISITVIITISISNISISNTIILVVC